MIDTTFRNVDNDRVQQFERIIVQMLQDRYPQSDFDKGSVLYDLVVRPQALYLAVADSNGDMVRKSNSLLEISRDPSIADEDIVDAVLSNYNVTRTIGSRAAGAVTITLTSNATTPIASGTRFTYGILTFVTDTSFVGVPTQALASRPTDRLIRQVGVGVYEFTIEVIAEQAGSDSQLTQHTNLTISNAPPNYVRSYATYDFSTGAAEETNEDLIAKLAVGAAGKTMSSRLNIESLIKSEFPTVETVSTIGYGDAEMLRDKHNLFGGAFGGKSDIYVQASTRPIITRTTKQATLVNASDNIWQIAFNRDEAAGVYRIEKVSSQLQPPDIGELDDCGDIITDSLPITDTVLSINTSPLTGGFIPDIERFEEGAFTRFQEITVKFKDVYTPTVGLTPMVSTKDYFCDLLHMPHIADIQDFVSDRSRAAVRYDDVVRAPLPCVVRVVMVIKRNYGVEVNVGAVSSALANAINSMGFTNELPVSILIDAAQSTLPAGAKVYSQVDMVGEFITPAGETVIRRSSNTLTVPVDYANSVSARTAMFFSSSDRITVELQTM